MVSITTPTWIRRASVGFAGRIRTAITRNIGKGTCTLCRLLGCETRELGL